jgi:hypothetical protein
VKIGTLRASTAAGCKTSAKVADVAVDNRTRSTSPSRARHLIGSSSRVIQYVGSNGGWPTSVDDQPGGSFVAVGSPQHQFRYVVFNQPGQRN